MKSKDELLKILFVQLKGNRKKIYDWVFVAEACKELIDNYGYTVEKLRNEVSVKADIIRQILLVLKQPEEIKFLIKKRKILLDTSYKLSLIKNINKRIKLAEIVKDVSSKDARDIIDYSRRNSNLSFREIKNYKERVLNSKDKKIPLKIHMIILPMKKENYILLNKIARRKKTNVQNLISDIVENELKKMKS